MESGALFEISGTIPTNATWAEDIYFSEAGAAMDISDLDWKMTFRRCQGDTSADITLSTDDGTLVVAADDDGNDRILRTAVPAGTLNSYCGDFICDLASQDSLGAVKLWANGIVTLKPNPIAF